MTRKYFLGLIAVAITTSLLIIGSCKKEKTKANDFTDVTANISYTGEIAYDGCGWQVKIDNTYYHPDNLAADMQVNNSSVVLSGYITADRYGCGNARNSTGLAVIHIVSIAKK